MSFTDVPFMRRGMLAVLAAVCPIILDLADKPSPTLKDIQHAEAAMCASVAQIRSASEKLVEICAAVHYGLRAGREIGATSQALTWNTPSGRPYCSQRVTWSCDDKFATVTLSKPFSIDLVEIISSTGNTQIIFNFVQQILKDVGCEASTHLGAHPSRSLRAPSIIRDWHSVNTNFRRTTLRL